MSLSAGLLAVTIVLQTPALKPAERAAFDRLSEATIRDVTTALAARGMEGRGTGQPGADRAAEYLAGWMRRLGLAPLGDSGSYLQRVPFTSSEVLATSTMTGAAPLSYRTDFLVTGALKDGTTDLSAPLVFAGYGLGLEGRDVRGKVLVVVQGRPARADTVSWLAVDLRGAVRRLVAAGVAAVVIIPDPSGPPFSAYGQYLTRRAVRMADASRAPTVPAPTIFVNEAALDRLAPRLPALIRQARAGSGEPTLQDVGGTVRIAVRARVQPVTSSNVVGVLRGSDPRLAGQAVVFTAHYDAYGIDNGTVYPGAADNALGTAMMLAAAETFARGNLKPRRSVIFLAVTGEEYGLFGARWWADHPTWPIDSVAADFNYDGIGTETYGPVTRVVGWGGEFSTLGPMLNDVVSATGNTVIPDPFPEERAFERSDHFAFVLRGVPALMLLGAPMDTGWVHRAKAWLEGGDYHQPGDSIHTGWNWSGPRTLAATGLLLGLRAANSDSMPAWLPGAPYQRH